MSDFDPFDPICADCGLPLSHPDHDEGDADVDDERAARADFDARVDARTAQLLAEHKAVSALVAHRLAPTVVPKPRTDLLDALEHARITKLREARDFEARVQRKVQDLKMQLGTAEFVVFDGEPGSRADASMVIPRERAVLPSRAEYFKEASVNLEFRDCISGDA